MQDFLSEIFDVSENRHIQPFKLLRLTRMRRYSPLTCRSTFCPGIAQGYLLARDRRADTRILRFQDAQEIRGAIRRQDSSQASCRKSHRSSIPSKGTVIRLARELLSPPPVQSASLPARHRDLSLLHRDEHRSALQIEKPRR